MTATPGRSCPLHYRYRPGEIAAAPVIEADVAWVVGGLYGNPEALAAILDRVAEERSTGARVALVYNGDFHWFDTDPGDFDRIQAQVLSEHALVGNIELELGRPDPGAGCGCAYPDFVDDATVERSNRIIERLQATARARPGACTELAELPRVLRLRIGGHTTAVIHGDPESIAGWEFSIERVTDPLAPLSSATVERWARDAAVDAFAGSHTCLPWAARFGEVVVINNGSAGMPNFRADPRAIVTRIAATGSRHPAALYGVERGKTRWEAVAIAFDHDGWWRRFTREWPEGSPAHDSYALRLRHGPDHDPQRARPRVVSALA